MCQQGKNPLQSGPNGQIGKKIIEAINNLVLGYNMKHKGT